MAIGELSIGALIAGLFEKLASRDLIRLARSAGIYYELVKWTGALTQIQAVLADAGQKHIQNRAIQLWLNKLQHLAYEIEEVLDDLSTETMRKQLNQESYASTRKVLKFIPSKFHDLKYGRVMMIKIDDITTKLPVLIEEANLLGLNAEIPNTAASPVPIQDIIGRESDKDALLEKLLSSKFSSSQNVSVVSIVGPGGIGKTTLAQLLYNDNAVKDHFELMAWVCVSDKFDILNITKAILKSVGGGNQDFASLNIFQRALKEKLSMKRFLFVLDDVWNEDYNKWELLQRPFIVGARGSKILMTTRKSTVVSMIDSVQTYPLELLSHEEALSLFVQHATSSKQDFDANLTLKLHGEDIVKKCDRLPLALRMVGRVFRTKSNVEDWKKLLNNEIWDLDNGNGVLPALQLSYNDLPPHLKRMFEYCCLFPKNYIFDKDELVLLWMAEEFLSKSKSSKSIESFGHECFEELVSRSFFQHPTNDKSWYGMHDLIHDMATRAAGEFFCISDDKIDGYNWRVRYLSFIRERFGAYTKFKEIQKSGHLRTLLSMPVTRLGSWDTSFISNKVFTELLPNVKSVRVLSLSNYNITMVPQSIGSLKYMRYLNFSNTRIRGLPKEVGNLHNLQSLLLSGCCELSSLPNSIVKLVNLRHLDISDTPKLNKMPLGISQLTHLQTLSKVIIGGAGELGIFDLKGLLHLQGQLSIEGLHRVRNAVHAREANLPRKKGICDLKMKWSDVFDGSQNETTEYQVLEELRPFENLTSLEIVYYRGIKFPSWVGDSSFVFLNQLTLRGCRSCTCLPTLGHLPSLQKLFVESMDRLKRLCFNDFRGVAFPSLEVVRFSDMMCWEEWLTSDTHKVGAFPCLLEISLINCPKLDVVEIELIPSLQVLRVEGCSLAVLRSMVGVSSSIDRLQLQNIKGLAQLHGKMLQHLMAVEYLNISLCADLTSLWVSQAVPNSILLSLQKLEVIGRENLVSFGEKELDQVISVESVTEVRIEGCPRLESFYCPNKIVKLVIDDCPSVTSIAFPTLDDLPPTLKVLDIMRCGNVEVSWLLNNFLLSLESLSLWRVSNLSLFPEGSLFYLTVLTIWDCENIESIPDNGYGFLPFLCLRELEIYNCKNLKSFPHTHLQNLTLLEEMKIINCPSLDHSFPSGLWPPNLSSLEIGGLKKPISEWGLQNFPISLVSLELYGENSGAVSFAKIEDDMGGSSSFLLPSTLTYLHIDSFNELESLSEGLQHLTSLETLSIFLCPKLRDLPETLLPSLSSLRVLYSSPEVNEKCSEEGIYWPIISQIPDLKLYLD